MWSIFHFTYYLLSNQQNEPCLKILPLSSFNHNMFLLTHNFKFYFRLSWLPNWSGKKLTISQNLVTTLLFLLQLNLMVRLPYSQNKISMYHLQEFHLKIAKRNEKLQFNHFFLPIYLCSFKSHNPVFSAFVICHKKIKSKISPCIVR